MPLKWEFPGGKIEPGETPEAALARELEEELSVIARVGSLVGQGSAQNDSRTVVLGVYEAVITSGDIVLREHAQYGWFTADELVHLDWADADIPVLSAVCRRLREHRE